MGRAERSARPNPYPDSAPLLEPSVPHGRRVDVSDIARTPGATRAFETEFVLEGLSVPLASITGPVRVSGVLEGVIEGVVVVAEVSADMRESCRRCLEERVRRVCVDVTELFTSGAEADDDVYPLEDGSLDLDQCARDALALELPEAPLLCEGDPESCPNLERLREKGFMDGPEGRTDPRWAPLAELRIDLDKEK